ncbi:MAG: hypothetical protein GY913_24575 [Proteobacteria bacterium]|nr:hypothetical protein [Pseudomonadota bacterium]MCP4920090.1 hypothetical protein [Pseudomonadota bacterium]
MLFLLASAALAQDAPTCPAPTSLSQLKDATVRGEESFANLDIDGLGQAAGDAETALPCLSEAITPRDAAAYHRLMGMHAFATQERERVKYEFHAARKLEPGYEVPQAVAPTGHPMIAAYEEAVLVDEGALSQPVPPEGGYVTVGGVRGAARAELSPAILQVFEEGDALSETLYLSPGAELPMWGPLPEPLPEPKQLRRPMLAATAATGVVALGLQGVAWSSKNKFLDTDTADADLEGLYARNRATYFSSVGVGAVAVGLGTVTLLVW